MNKKNNPAPPETKEDAREWLKNHFENILPSPDNLRAIAWNPFGMHASVFDLLTLKELFRIEADYEVYYWINAGKEIVATDKRVTYIYDGFTGKILRNVEATY